MRIEKDGTVLFDAIKEARTFWQRFRGLMGVTFLKEGEGLWFENCSSIHCFFMKIPIDVVYFDKQYRIVGIETVQPWKIGHRYKGARHILEVGAGAASRLQVGDVLVINR
ncbi:MAG: DUF192 domain-containing protein [Lachnospiraceae bacterium]